MHPLRTQTLQQDDLRQDFRGQLEVKREELTRPQAKTGPDFPVANTTPMRALPLDDSPQLFRHFDHQAISAEEDSLVDIHYDGHTKEKKASKMADHVQGSQ